MQTHFFGDLSLVLPRIMPVTLHSGVWFLIRLQPLPAGPISFDTFI